MRKINHVLCMLFVVYSKTPIIESNIIRVYGETKNFEDINQRHGWMLKIRMNH